MVALSIADEAYQVAFKIAYDNYKSSLLMHEYPPY